MPKKASPEKKKAEVLFRKGIKTADIAQRLGVPAGTVRRWKAEYEAAERNSPVRSDKRAENEHETSAENEHTAQARIKGKAPRVVIRRGSSQARPGNVNSVGNHGGPPLESRNAEIHGLYAKYLPEETMEIMDGLADQSPLDSLWQQILNQRAIILRSQKIFEQKRGEVTREIVSETDDGTTYMVQEPWDKEAQYINAFSRAQATLQSMIKTYYEIEGQSKQDAASGAKDWKAAILEIANRRKKDAGNDNA